MPRPAKFDHDQILDAALGLLATGGPGAANAVAVARTLGAPSGSIYHRFAGRDHLVGAVWLRAVQRFQRGWFTALEHADAVQGGGDAARHVVRWSHENPAEATVLARHSLADVLTSGVPDELTEPARTQRRQVAAALRGFLARHQILETELPRVRLAVIGIPHAILRDAFIDNGTPTQAHEEIAAEAAAGLLQPLVRPVPEGRPTRP